MAAPSTSFSGDVVSNPLISIPRNENSNEVDRSLPTDQSLRRENLRDMSKHNVVRSMNQPASPLNAPRRLSSQTPKTPSSPTIEQLLHSDATRWSGSYSPTLPALGRDHDPEEDHTPLHKKSVLAKVKERAIRWRQNLRKKKQSQDGNSTPSWGVSLNDDNDDGPDGDPEYLGAPMYESELAPEVLKETARQHPREVQVTSEMRTVPDNASEDTRSQEKENPPNSPKHKANYGNKVERTSPTKTLTESVTAKLAPAYETVTEKLAPAYATISEKTHNIAAKFQSLTVSTPNEQRGLTESNHQQTYDKGVSVKEYLFQKFEPGDDEKALSKAITEAISPKKSPDGKGVVKKMREAVSSLLGTEEATPSKGTPIAAAPTNAVAASSISKLAPPYSNTTSTSTMNAATRNSSPAMSTTISSTSTNKPRTTNSASNYQAPSYVHEAMEEESHGRILQAN